MHEIWREKVHCKYGNDAKTFHDPYAEVQNVEKKLNRSLFSSSQWQLLFILYISFHCFYVIEGDMV